MLRGKEEKLHSAKDLVPNVENWESAQKKRLLQTF